LIDPEELPTGVPFTYFAEVVFVDGKSGVSNFSTIVAVNDPPLAVADAYSTTRNTPLSIGAPGVLSNDTDDDSPAAAQPVVISAGPRGAVLVTGPTTGTVTLKADGSFTYTPKSGFTGTDSFTYKTNDGNWSRDATVPLSVDSNVVTVTITVTAK
jgi:hypothetical protein